jgi:thiamine biosynthesis protein ThiC
MRNSWVASRKGKTNVSQMHFARKGEITEEMVFVSKRENLPESLVMEEVARGRMIIPANINHTNLEPMAIGIASKCKVNANIGASPNASDINEELKKLELAVKYGADTLMDLSTGGVNLDEVRKAIIQESPVPIGTVPIGIGEALIIAVRTSSKLTPPVDKSIRVSAPYLTASSSFFNSSFTSLAFGEAPIFALTLHLEAIPIAIGSKFI